MWRYSKNERMEASAEHRNLPPGVRSVPRYSDFAPARQRRGGAISPEGFHASTRRICGRRLLWFGHLGRSKGTSEASDGILHGRRFSPKEMGSNRQKNSQQRFRGVSGAARRSYLAAGSRPFHPRIALATQYGQFLLHASHGDEIDHQKSRVAGGSIVRSVGVVGTSWSAQKSSFNSHRYRAD